MALPYRVLQAAIIGYGKYGRCHARKYDILAGVSICGIVDMSEERRRQAASELPGTRTFKCVGHLLAETAPDLASIAVPAEDHYVVAGGLLNAGVHVLVEKPMATRRVDALDLLQLARRQQLVLQPGHLERFNHTLAELHSRIPTPHYVEARRLAPWSGRATDVDVVLDLMIHDIDMLMEIVDSSISTIRARGVKVFSDRWDVANAQLGFDNGCTASLTASRVSPRGERRLHVFSESTCVLADIDQGLMLLHHRDAQGRIGTERCLCRHEDPLAAEIQEFVAAVRARREPSVTARDGYRAVDVALRITEAMENDEKLLERAGLPWARSDSAVAWLQRLQER